MGGLLRGSVAEVAVVGHGYPPRLVSAGIEGVVVCLWGSVGVGFGWIFERVGWVRCVVGMG